MDPDALRKNQVKIAQRIADLALIAGEDCHPDDHENAQAHAVSILACIVESLLRVTYQRRAHLFRAMHRPDLVTEDPGMGGLRDAHHDAERLLLEIQLKAVEL